jgi:hypothetical protein
MVNICTTSSDVNGFYILRARYDHVEWISEQRAIIYPYNINLIVFITETVFTARYELNFYVKFRLIVVFKELNKVM